MSWELDVTSSVKTDVVREECAAASAMFRRRLVFLTLAGLSSVALVGLMALTLSAGGLTLLDAAIVAMFAVTVPYAAIGFWNAVVGLVLMRFARDPVALTCPPVANADPSRPVTSRTALAVCIRNEDVDGVFARLSAMLDDLAHAGLADRFAAFVLSDTNAAGIALEEERAFERLRARFGDRFELAYRRRSDNPGFKAGNIADFCERWGETFDFMLVLDADSYMSAAAIRRLVATMEASPELGILQTLVIGTPALSPFTRVFQFGMRLGMRSHTLGAAWWQGDCGPYWGHNALIRMAPFREHCRLARIPGKGPLSGWVLSHDQVEAVLMRRAGYHVRVVPVEAESWEANPPSLTEFIRRELRWCQGNTQYLRLLAVPGLLPLSRLQLVLAILMYFGSAAWVAMMTTFAAGFALTGGAEPRFRGDTGVLLLATILTMIFAPKLASIIDVVSRTRSRRAFGGPLRIAASVFGELVFFALIAPAVAVSVTVFLLGLPFGRRITWAAQQRAAERVPLAVAAARLWPQLAFGAALTAVYAAISADALALASPIVAGLLVAVPLTVVTSSTGFGQWLARIGLFRLPEETAPPLPLVPLALPALAQPAPVHASGAGAPARAVSEAVQP